MYFGLYDGYSFPRNCARKNLNPRTPNVPAEQRFGYPFLAPP